MSVTLAYRAFMSYSHHDKRAAKRWHRRLEAFAIDPNLVGRPTSVGPLPATLSPICRDEIDLPAAGDLSSEIRAKLDSAAALLVMASPRAAISPYVQDEILYFRREHPDRPVCTLILSGKPGHPTRECRPPALRETVDTNGQLTGKPFETLMANPSTHYR